jgi:hypothetical protein
MNQQDIASAIYRAVMFKDITSTSLSNYMARAEIGLITPSLYAIELSSRADAAANLSLGMLYKVFFNEYIVPSERVSDVTQTSDKVNLFIGDSSDLKLSASELKNVTEMIDSQTLSWSEAGLKLTEFVDALDISAAILHTTLLGSFDDYVRPAAALNANEAVATVITSSISVLIQREAESQPVPNYVGTSSADIVEAYPTTETITAGGGDDQIILAANDGETTRIVFEKDLSTNGVDLIKNFERGADGDMLDFSSFLTVPDLSLVDTTVSATDITETELPNGAVVVIEGTALLSSSTIAELFGAGLPFASPTDLSKYVFITANLSRDSDIWYVLNNSNTSLIESSEVTKVGTLNGLNSFSLYPFDQANFFSVDI